MKTFVTPPRKLMSLSKLPLLPNSNHFDVLTQFVSDCVSTHSNPVIYMGSQEDLVTIPSSPSKKAKKVGKKLRLVLPLVLLIQQKTMLIISLPQPKNATVTPADTAI